MQQLQHQAAARLVRLQATATDAELLRRLEELQEENKRLKQELAKFAAVTTAKAAAGAAAAIASPAAAAAASEVLETSVTAPPAAAAGTDAFLVSYMQHPRLNSDATWWLAAA